LGFDAISNVISEFEVQVKLLTNLVSNEK